MPLPRNPSRAAGLALALLVAAAGCGHRIGDSCNTNSDCSALGDRFCDLSNSDLVNGFGGYCTIEGCDVRMNTSGSVVDSCPSEAVCVRFFQQIESQPCDIPTSVTDCAAGELCRCDCPDPNHPGFCLPPGTYNSGGTTCTAIAAGHCAPISSERRWCQLRCNTDSDCRTGDGYKCLAAGSNGSELVARGVAHYAASMFSADDGGFVELKDGGFQALYDGGFVALEDGGVVALGDGGFVTLADGGVAYVNDGGVAYVPDDRFAYLNDGGVRLYRSYFDGGAAYPSDASAPQSLDIPVACNAASTSVSGTNNIAVDCTQPDVVVKFCVQAAKPKKQ